MVINGRFAFKGRKLSHHVIKHHSGCILLFALQYSRMKTKILILILFKAYQNSLSFYFLPFQYSSPTYNCKTCQIAKPRLTEISLNIYMEKHPYFTYLFCRSKLINITNITIILPQPITSTILIHSMLF